MDKQEEINIRKKANRKRPYTINFRVSAEEKERIEQKIKASGLRKTDFLIRALTDKNIVVIENAPYLLTELKRQGNNLNQAVKNYYFGKTTEKEMQKTLDECKTLYRRLVEKLGGG